MSRSGALYVGEGTGGPYLNSVSGGEGLIITLVYSSGVYMYMGLYLTYQVVTSSENGHEWIGSADRGDGEGRVIVLHGGGTFN